MSVWEWLDYQRNGSGIFPDDASRMSMGIIRMPQNDPMMPVLMAIRSLAWEKWQNGTAKPLSVQVTLSNGE